MSPEAAAEAESPSPRPSQATGPFWGAPHSGPIGGSLVPETPPPRAPCSRAHSLPSPVTITTPPTCRGCGRPPRPPLQSPEQGLAEKEPGDACSELGAVRCPRPGVQGRPPLHEELPVPGLNGSSSHTCRTAPLATDLCTILRPGRSSDGPSLPCGHQGPAAWLSKSSGLQNHTRRTL